MHAPALPCITDQERRAMHVAKAQLKHGPHPNAIKPKCANFDPNFASNSKTAHFERKRWAPPFKPCPRGVHWWWSRPNWLSWRRETWLGPSKQCHLGPLWMEGKNCPRGSEKLMGTARGHKHSDIFFSAPELNFHLSSGDCFLGFWVITFRCRLRTNFVPSFHRVIGASMICATPRAAVTT